jgi:hypothetical protein
MYTPTTAWDRAPTDRELESFYGKPAKTEVKDNYFEVLTETVRKVPAKNLSLPYVSYRNVPHFGSIESYPLTEVIEDYMGYDKPMEALMAVFEKSDCPLVAKLREAIAERFADANADELEAFKAGEEE